MSASLKTAAVLCLLFSCFTTSLSHAHQAPTEKQIAELKKKGIYEKVMKRAEEMAHTHERPGLVRRFKQKIDLAQLQAAGRKGDLNSLQKSSLPSDLTGLPTTGTPRVLTLLIDFEGRRANVRHPQITADRIRQNIYGDGTAEAQDFRPFESVNSYYERASEGRLDLQGDVVGFYNYPGTQESVASFSSEPDNAVLFDLIADALRAFDATTDFSQYDNDGDGYIDALNVIYSGERGNWSTFWWAYKWQFFSPASQRTFFDGKRLSTFTFQSLDTRANNSDFDPQTLIHETGHLLGLPDLYDYKRGQGNEGGVGGFDIMDANKGNPNAFFRWMMDWIQPEIVAAGAPVERSLRASGDMTAGDEAKAIVIFPEARQTPFQEFFLVENRHRIGNDGGQSFLPSDGLAIWHVDATLDATGGNFRYNNTDRSFSPRKLVKLVQADGLGEIERLNGGRVDAGDYYVQGREFSPTSQPNSDRHDGRSTDVVVRNISRSGLVMTADIGFDNGTQRPNLKPGDPLLVLYTTEADAGESLTGRLNIQNEGTGFTDNFSVTYYLSRSTSGAFQQDIRLGSQEWEAIAQNSSRTRSFNLTLPAYLAVGNYRIGYQIDSNADIIESTESDNFGILNSQFISVTNGGVSAPNVSVLGSGVTISNGDQSPRELDGTDFGSVVEGSSAQRSYTITNSGTAELVLTSAVTLSGTNASEFAITSQPGERIAPGRQETFTVTFSPQSPDLKTAQILLESSDTDTTEYRFAIQGTGLSNSDDHGNVIEDATSVGINSTTPGNLETEGDFDVFQVVLSEEGTLRAQSSGTTDTFGELLSATGQILQSNDDGGPSLNFLLERNLSPGIYYVRLRGYQSRSVGAYSLDVTFDSSVTTDDHGDETGVATVISPVTTLNGVLEEVGDRDFFEITFTESGRFTAFSEGTTDTFGRLFSSASTLVVENDDGGLDRNFELSAMVEPGTYYLSVSGYQTTTGPYTFNTTFEPTAIVLDDHGNDYDTATFVGTDSVLPAELTAGDIDVFEFELTEPTSVTIFTTGTLDTFGILVDENAQTLTSNDDDGEGSNFSFTSQLAPGVYYVGVAGFLGATGSCEVHFELGLPGDGNDDDDGGGETDSEVIAPITGLLRLPNNRVLVEFEAQEDFEYRVWVSTDMINWQPRSNWRESAGDGTESVVIQMNGEPTCFFRIEEG